MTTPEKIGRYEIIERVGRGGMGVLYRGRDTVLEREVAIKVMSTDFEADSDDSARPRFYREARAAAKLQHRNIVTIFEFGEADNTPFIVMEFLRGQDLAKRMRSEPPLPLETKLDIVADLCTGLHFAHEQGVIHRDVKPANIWILPDGSVKLLDFGIAKFSSSTMTRQGAVFGSVSYMAPEQVSGGEIDGRADVFSAGVVLYELLTGKKPFEAETATAVLARIMDDQPVSLAALPPEVPPPLAAALAKALEKDRNQRYRHAADFGADLRLVRSALAAADVQPVEIDITKGLLQRTGTIQGPTIVREPAGAVQLVAAESPVSAAESIAGGRRRWFVPAVAVLVVLIGVTAFLLTRGGQSPDQPTQGPTSGGAPASAPAATPPGATPVEPRTAPPPATEPAATPGEPAPAAAGPAAGGPGATAAPPAPAPKPVDVTITGSYPFEVLEGRTVRSPMAESHRIPVTGRTALRLRAPDYFLDRQVFVDAGTRQVSAPELGRLSLRSSLETCSLVIAGRNLGEPPYEELQIAAGSYSIQVSCPDGPGRQVPVTVNVGELQRVFITK